MDDRLLLVGGVVLRLILIGAVIWVAYRFLMKGLVFLRALTRPVRRSVRGVLDPIERAAAGHVARSLEEAGMDRAGNAARRLPDAAAKVEAAIGRELDRHASPKK